MQLSWGASPGFDTVTGIFFSVLSLHRECFLHLDKVDMNHVLVLYHWLSEFVVVQIPNNQTPLLTLFCLLYIFRTPVLSESSCNYIVTHWFLLMYKCRCTMCFQSCTPTVNRIVFMDLSPRVFSHQLRKNCQQIQRMWVSQSYCYTYKFVNVLNKEQ